jgi:hypothetical protein
MPKISAENVDDSAQRMLEEYNVNIHCKDSATQGFYHDRSECLIQERGPT